MVSICAIYSYIDESHFQNVSHAFDCVNSIHLRPPIARVVLQIQIHGAISSKHFGSIWVRRF